MFISEDSFLSLITLGMNVRGTKLIPTLSRLPKNPFIYEGINSKQPNWEKNIKNINSFMNFYSYFIARYMHDNIMLIMN